MATRSTIGLRERRVYCHWDGYPETVGKILLEHYNTKERVFALISYGDISSLRRRIVPDEGYDHTFDNRQEDVTVFYHRDRGDPLNPPRYIPYKEEEEYNYIFNSSTGWHFYEYGNKNRIKHLESYLDSLK